MEIIEPPQSTLKNIPRKPQTRQIRSQISTNYSQLLLINENGDSIIKKHRCTMEASRCARGKCQP